MGFFDKFKDKREKYDYAEFLKKFAVLGGMAIGAAALGGAAALSKILKK